MQNETLKNIAVKKHIDTLLRFLPDPVLAFSRDNRVEYVNPAFEKVFGWTFEEIRGKNIRFIPDHLREQARQGMKQLYKNRSVHDFETQRYAKDGRILDIMISGSILYDDLNTPVGQVLILRDMTIEKRMKKTSRIMFRISKALHHYHKLGDLITLITGEIQQLVSVEGAFILLADKSAPEDQLYFFSASYRDSESEARFKKIRFSAAQGVSGRVYTTGEPMIIHDVENCPFFLKRVDDETGLVTKNILSVPIRLKNKIIGVVSVVNKKYGRFDDTDIALLSMVTGAIALPIENTRIHEELKKSYDELRILNNAKDRVINHLAHELKTPVSVVDASMKLVAKKIRALNIDSPVIEKIIARGRRNLARILDIQYESEDLLKEKDFRAFNALTRLFGACRDELALLFADHCNEPDAFDLVEKAIEKIFFHENLEPELIELDRHVQACLDSLKPEFSPRKCILNTQIEKAGQVLIPPGILDVVITGILKNAVEYTPDGSAINIETHVADNCPELIVRDYGIGFTREKLQLLFEGYFTPPDSDDYSTGCPYEFNAGGRGFDLLRIKIFSETYGFSLGIYSERCCHIPKDTDRCPGNIASCPACRTSADCFDSGGTRVVVKFGQ
jgi:PAS domain S-box-containing protein